VLRHRVAIAHRTTRRTGAACDGHGDHHGREGTQRNPRQSSHLSGEVEALEGIDHAQLEEIAQDTRERCTISIALEATVTITYDIIAR
jgi:organic hydroperoxide reductase OsmC/OhrA